MKLLNLTFAAAVTGLFLGAGTSAHAITVPVFDSYVFNSITSDTSLDGSTITIEGSVSGHTLFSWNLVDANNGIDFTPANSFFDTSSSDIISYDASTWTGNFTVTSDVFNGGSFAGANSPEGGSLDFSPSVNVPNVDPPGPWTPVPDVASSFQLCALALGALGVFHLYLRRQATVPAQN